MKVGVAMNGAYVHAKQDGALLLRLFALTPLASWHHFFIYAVIFGCALIANCLSQCSRPLVPITWFVYMLLFKNNFSVVPTYATIRPVGGGGGGNVANGENIRMGL
jgi:hypothetical protein